MAPTLDPQGAPSVRLLTHQAIPAHEVDVDILRLIHTAKVSRMSHRLEGVGIISHDFGISIVHHPDIYVAPDAAEINILGDWMSGLEEKHRLGYVERVLWTDHGEVYDEEFEQWIFWHGLMIARQQRLW